MFFQISDGVRELGKDNHLVLDVLLREKFIQSGKLLIEIGIPLAALFLNFYEPRRIFSKVKR